MTSNWPRVRLGDICRFKYGEMPKKTDLADKGYPVFSGYRLVGHATRYHYSEPEIIVVARGVGGTGDIKMSPPFCFLTNLSIAILLEAAKVYKPFLFYRLTSTTLWELRTGSAQAQITIEHLKHYELNIPPFPVQKRIAAILSTYDELIENSQRRIKILEAMARGLYREWFVHFRFPGHENHPRVASALGEIPQGWAVKKVGDLVEFKKGKKPTAVFESAESGLKRHLLIDALRGGSSLEFVMPDKLISTTVDDTIMVMDGSGSGDVFIGYEGVIGSTLGRYRVVDVSDGGPFWLFLFLDTHLEEIKSKNIGSAIPHANKDFINGMSVAVAPKSVLLNFEKAVTPMFGLIRSLRSKTDALRRTRDLLLPRLLSGQIEVGGT